MLGVALEVSGHSGPRVAEGAANSFGIVGMGLKESSVDNTPLHFYAGGSEDSRVIPPTPGRSAICEFFLPPPCSLLSFFGLA